MKPPLSPFQSSSGSTSEDGTETKTSASETSVIRDTGDGFVIVSRSGRTRLLINHWSFIHEAGGHFQLGSLSPESTHMHAQSLKISSKICNEVKVLINRACRDLFSSSAVLNQCPRFTNELSVSYRHRALLVGWCLYLPAPAVDMAAKLLPAKAYYLEIQMPSQEVLLECEPARLVIYLDSSRTELVTVLPLGYRGNRSSLLSRCSHSRSADFPDDVIVVEGHQFRFRCPEEAAFWRVAIEDSVSCTPGRFKDLFGSARDTGRVPKGYRGQFSRLESILSELSDPVVPHDNNILERCSTCIEYLVQRLMDCKCSKAFDSAKEDLLLETRQLLKMKLRSNSTVT